MRIWGWKVGFGYKLGTTGWSTTRAEGGGFVAFGEI